MIRDLLAGVRDLKMVGIGAVTLVAVVSTELVRVDRLAKKAYQTGRADERNAANFDSTLRAAVDSNRTKTKAQVETVFRTLRAAVAKVDTQAIAAAALASRIPPTVRDPVVDSLKQRLPVLVASVAALTAKVDTLARALKADSAATKVSLEVRDGLIRNARLENARQAAMILALEKRPTRAQAALLSLGSAAAGAACGRWC